MEIQFPLFHSVLDPGLSNGIIHDWSGSFHLHYSPLWKYLHSYVQRFISWVTLNSIKLTMKTNYHRSYLSKNNWLLINGSLRICHQVFLQWSLCCMEVILWWVMSWSDNILILHTQTVSVQQSLALVIPTDIFLFNSWIMCPCYCILGYSSADWGCCCPLMEGVGSIEN